MFKQRMMPGQTPYTDEERAKLRKLLDGAMAAEEMVIGTYPGSATEAADELEREVYAARRRDQKSAGKGDK